MTQDILSSREEIAKFDKSNVLGSVEALADQVRHAWEDTKKITFNPGAEIRNVVVAGMGGSGLGAHLIKTVFKNKLKVPFDIANSYTLPEYVDENSLVLLASYSGGTEETLACAQDAINRHAQVMVICAGGKLAELAKQNNWTIYIINPTHNPSNQPRMAIGYAVFGTIALLAKAGIISLTQTEVDEVITTIIDMAERCNPDVAADSNPAKLIAYQTHNLRPIFFGAEFMEGPLHVSTNQFNENAKIYADYKVLPEVNHHLMEGLRFPETNEHTHLFIFVNSKLYSARNQARMELTPQVVEQNHIPTFVVDLESPTPLTQAFESITLFGFAGLYLCILEGIDPAPIPFVDWFKQELEKV
jgi:glucose/mannose-6-phosphate isomerase